MSPCYKITCGDTEIIRKGKLESISITVAKRSGNKKVTLVDNLEIYGINIDEVASACQRGVAASTNINRSQTPKKTDQLQIQGNQVLFVFNLLQGNIAVYVLLYILVCEYLFCFRKVQGAKKIY